MWPAYGADHLGSSVYEESVFSTQETPASNPYA